MCYAFGRHAQVKEMEDIQAMEDIQMTDSSVAYDSEGNMDEDIENSTMTLIFCL